MLPTYSFNGCKQWKSGGHVVEARRHQKNSWYHERKKKPDYGKLVDLLTQQLEMIIPSLLPVLSPIFLYFIILQIGGLEEPFLLLEQCFWVLLLQDCLLQFNDSRWWHGIMLKNILKTETMAVRGLKHINLQ